MIYYEQFSQLNLFDHQVFGPAPFTKLGHEVACQGPFDVAVLQHVLCSVEAPHQLLLLARQRLKPGDSRESNIGFKWV